MTGAPYVPGRNARSVTKTGYPPVEVPESPGQHRRRSRPVMAPRWGAHGTLAVVTVLAASLIADTATLLLIAWWQR